MRNIVRIIIILLLMPLLTITSFGEKIITLVTKEIPVPGEHDTSIEAQMHLEEAISLYISDNTEFLKALNISIFIPNTLKQHSDSFMLQVFKGVTPQPQKGKRTLYGKQVFHTFLPYLNRIYLQIPIKSQGDNGESTNPKEGKYVLKTIGKKDFPILITIQPLMKGIPDYIFTKYFSFTVKSILENMGYLQLAIEKTTETGEEGIEKTYTLLIDDREYPEIPEKIKLTSGIHQIEIKSETYEESSLTITIEPGKTTVTNIKLKPRLSTVKFDTPENAIIYIDGKKLAKQQRKINLNEGEHIIRIKIEDYSITRKLNVKRNKQYIVSLIFDILLKEY